MCYCHLVRPFRSGPRVLVLRHPRERRSRLRVNTGEVVRRCVVNSRLLDGLDFWRDQALNGELAENAWLVFPGPDSVDLSDLRGLGPGGQPEAARAARGQIGPPPLLVFLDSSWTCANAMLLRNEALAGLPRVTFRAPGDSLYRFRRQPRDGYRSTAEAVYWCLELLRPWWPGRPSQGHRNLLDVLRFLVACQEPRRGKADTNA